MPCSRTTTQGKFRIGCLSAYHIFNTTFHKLEMNHVHWCSSHKAITHMHNKNSNFQRRSPNVVKIDFPYHKELLFKVIIHSQWKRILFLKGSFHFEKGGN